ncbi:MAG TPA: ABC transporter substrate-binding protein [Nocardioides sp.]|jgi:peptide/nickel transport system substrate-binding protein|nr:ABC transporter substrate-binding protein [Nocardioides sp.]
MKHVSRTRSTAFASVLLLASALAFGACAGSDNKTEAAGGGTLTIQGDAGNPQLVENFNPLVLATELHGAQLMYEPLEIRSPIDGSFTPFLATGHTFPNPKTVVFTIRQNVTWSDGKPFTAQDVVFTYDLLKKFPALDSSGIWSQISGAKASGNKVTVTFKKPNVPFVGVLASQVIVPQHIWSTIKDPTKFTNTTPVGTGPFTLDKFAPTQYSLKKNTSYWQADKIAPDEVVMPAQSTNQSTNQLDVTSGKFDWSYNYLPDVDKTYVSRDKAHNTYWFPPGGTIGLFLNLTKAPYQNVDFRKGISAALDRDTIAQKAVNGYEKGASQSGLILPNLQKWLDPSIPNSGNITQDTSGAVADFKKAGYTQQGGKLLDSSGQQVSMTIMAPSNYSDWIAAAKEVVNELGAIGIKVTLDTPTAAQYTSATQSGNFDAAFGGYGGTGDPYTDFNNTLNSAFAAPVGTPTANNFERFKDPKVDAALNALAGATGQARQQKAVHQLENIMYDQVPVVLMYYGGSWGLFSTKNFTGWPSQSDAYALPTSYNDELLEVVTHLQRAS